MHIPRLIPAAICLAFAAMFASPTPARACGGFFCDTGRAVNQAAERMIFSRRDDGSVTAVIQIQYQGPAERFAWLLPVAGNPEIGVSSDLAFARLQRATNPVYLLQTRVVGRCSDDAVPAPPGPTDAIIRLDESDAGRAPEPPPVRVINHGTVGPFDFVVLSVDPSVSEAAQVAVEWLRANEYVIDELGVERIGPYLEGGMNLLAFRLTKGNVAGSIRPVVIDFGPGLASIPIRPTAVAAVNDMGVMVWVLGPARAIPVNYRALELNEALLDWLNPERSYDALVTEAANQAGGQGFVTEMSGPSRPLAEVIFGAGERERWEALRASPSNDVELVGAVVRDFGTFDGMRDVLEGNVPLPAGVSVDALLGCVSCVNLDPDGDGAIEGFDRAGLFAAMDEQVMAPMEATRALFDRDVTVTRLYTTMSADEMTLDPSFDFNGDLGSVDVLRRAERVIECDSSTTRAAAPWRVLLSSGGVVRGQRNRWPFQVGDGSMPANVRIRRMGTEGEGDVLVDNREAISSALASHNRTIPRAGKLGGSGGCAASGRGGSSASALVFLLLGVSLRSPRRPTSV
ncbi:MAG: DUF2330 domain-containing protein [Myxococcales bacterium]|nr:DUF2330 domain-containing protein [Myxococcales bacterium]